MFIAILCLAEQMFLLYHLCLAIINVFIVPLCALRPKMLETCDPEVVRYGILGEFVPPGDKGQVIFLDKSTSFEFSIYEGSYPVNPDSRPVAINIV